MGTDPIIRAASGTDAVNCLKLLRKVTGDLQGDEIRAIRHLLEVFETGVVLVAELDGRIVGTIAMRLLGDGGNIYLNEEWFCILPPFKSRGLARRLLSEVESLSDTMARPMRFGSASRSVKEYSELFSDPAYANHGNGFFRSPRREERNFG